MDLSVVESAVGSWVVLEVQGEVDVHSAPELLKRLTAVLSEENKSVIVDLDGLSFIDSTGLGTLVNARNQATGSFSTLRLVCNNERVLKLFRITGLDDVFAIFETTEAATTAS